MAVEISVNEEMERGANLEPDEIAPPLPDEKESTLLDGDRRTTLLVSGAAALVFLVWFWGAVVEPRLDWFGGGLSAGKQAVSGPVPGLQGADLHADKNLVKSVQHRLNELGFRAGRVDGVVGPRTMEALERFQMSQGIPVTGVIDEPTKEALDRIRMPKGKSKPYLVARARRENLKEGSRFIVDLSMDPALNRESVEKFIKQVTIRYARSNPDVDRFHVRGYLGIASLSAGAYAIADWTRKGKDVRALEGFRIRFQEWTRKDLKTTLGPPPK